MPGTPVAPSSLRRSAGWKATGLNAIPTAFPGLATPTRARAARVGDPGSALG